MDTEYGTSHDSVIAQAYEHVADDTKFIRLTTVTTFIHSMVFLLYIMYSISFVVIEKQGGNLPVGNIFSFMMQLFNGQHMIIFLLIVAVILAIGYFLLPPVAEASMIYYLDNHERKGTLSIGR